MRTEETSQFDKDGYLLLPNQFTQDNFNFVWLSDLEDGWKIYLKFKKDQHNVSYELVKPYKGEEFKLGDNVIPKKWYYAGSSQWGLNGFSEFAYNDCIRKHYFLTHDTTNIMDFENDENIDLEIKSLIKKELNKQQNKEEKKVNKMSDNNNGGIEVTIPKVVSKTVSNLDTSGFKLPEGNFNLVQVAELNEMKKEKAYLFVRSLLAKGTIKEVGAQKLTTGKGRPSKLYQANT